MGKKADRKKDEARIINVEIAPGNQQRMEEYRAAYNARPDRRTPKKKYTDIVNEALDRFLDANLKPVGSRRPAAAGTQRKKDGGAHGKGQAKKSGK